MSDVPRVCIDRRLPRHSLTATRTTGRPAGRRAIIVPGRMWVNGSTLRVHFMGGTQQQRQIAREQAAWWTEHANLDFAFVDDPRAEIRVAFDPADGAWSYLGTEARDFPAREPTMNLGFLEDGTAAHEFGHAIGLDHEHMSPFGGIEWNEEVVIRDLAGSPNYWTPAETRANVLDKYAVSQIRGTRFDRESIMLYFYPDAWVKNGRGTKQNAVLSALDKSFIASTRAYPGRGQRAPAPVALTVGARKAATARIGTPGEEDLFAFTVRKAGRHVARTGGKQDLVMQLFGPGSRTSLIATDDDSGLGLNARVIADLVPGEYFVQVRHVRKRGTGAYTVRVDRE